MEGRRHYKLKSLVSLNKASQLQPHNSQLTLKLVEISHGKISCAKKKTKESIKLNEASQPTMK
jgi:hypothetical protein